MFSLQDTSQWDTPFNIPFILKILQQTVGAILVMALIFSDTPMFLVPSKKGGMEVIY